jgi:DNA polymerase III alpha subunit
MPTLSLHSHSVYSQRDSIIKPEGITLKIKANGGTHYCVTDHGTAQGWLAVRDACKKNKLIPVYGVELYVNQFIGIFKQIQILRDAAPKKDQPQVILQAIKDKVFPLMSPTQAAYFMSGLDDPKDAGVTAKQLLTRLGYGYEHLVAVAVTAEGRGNLIRLHNLGWSEGNYYKPQVTTQQCLDHAKGIIWTTACLGGPIAKRFKYDPTGAEALAYLKQWEPMRDSFYLEVQPLDLLDQRRYNAQVLALHQATKFPLVLSQDNHHLNEADWIAHRALMLSQNDKTIMEIEARYAYKGLPVGFADLKKALGVETTWRAQEIIEQEKIQIVSPCGHHYGDVRLHWRTNDDVRKQCESTNPELLPWLDQCFAVTDRLCGEIKEIPWETKNHLTHYEDARTKALTICIQKLKDMGYGPLEPGDENVMVEDGYLIERKMKYHAWLAKEDKVITACGFWDYIWTLYRVTSAVQAEGIPIGYARGSGGGCLVMFLLGIIRVNPVEYGLFFERFLNPARLGLDPQTLVRVKPMASCPDADLDFSSIHRQRVIQITEQMFGKDFVVPVGTVGEAKLRTALADLCRVLKITQAEYMPVSKELPEDVNGTLSFDEAMKVPAFSLFVDKFKVLLALLPSMVGVVRSTGQHAGGVCIADVPVAQAVPVVRAGQKEGGGLVTGFGESGAERALESIGFIKFDFLATDTVDHVSLCARNLHEEHLIAGGESWVKKGERLLYPEQIPNFKTNDPAVMKAIFHTGNTDGIFQMEEQIGKQMVQLVKPDSVEEISDISTMIRPGCLQAACNWFTNEKGVIVNLSGSGLHFVYAARKFESSLNPPPNLPEAVLEVLRPTHYCCIYQEQMMFLIQVITGGKMSLGEGDIYRRAIEHGAKGKEDAIKTVADLEAQMKQIAAYPPEIVDQVCAIIKGGAAYSFNKAHALAYSLFSYAQAWFKHYHPHIFLASHVSLLAAKNKLEKAHKIINNGRSMGISINAPHVLHSHERASWSADKKTIYLPFTTVKGIKDETAAAIPRCASGCTTTLDFLLKARKDPSIKKNHLVDLARIGGFDGMEPLSRIKTVAAINYTLARCTTKQTDEVFKEHWTAAQQFCVLAEMSDQRKSQTEVEVFGSFVNESPLDKVIQQFQASGWTALSQIEPAKDEEFMVYFLVTGVTKKVHKTGNSKGKEWLKLTCWDGEGVGEVSIWAHDLVGKPEEGIMGYRNFIAPNEVYLAIVQADGERPVSLARRSVYAGPVRTVRETLFLKRSK